MFVGSHCLSINVMILLTTEHVIIILESVQNLDALLAGKRVTIVLCLLLHVQCTWPAVSSL